MPGPTIFPASLARPLRAVLIDDEPDCRADLRLSLGALDAMIEVAAEAETLAQAEAALARPDYNVVFLDVMLRGGTGFDLVPYIRPEANIVFVTAHDTFALRAFEVNALAYLLKPIDDARLAATVRRLVNLRPTDASELAAPPAFRLADSVLLRTDSDAARFVSLHDLTVIFSTANYTLLHLADGSRLIVRRTLKSWVEQLPEDFMRVHRTAIVNLHAVERATHVDRHVSHLKVAGCNEPVRARRELWSEIEQRLTRFGHKLV